MYMVPFNDFWEDFENPIELDNAQAHMILTEF